jgi:Predicted acyltransferases
VKVGEAGHPRLTYRPELDGIRGIAIGLVVLGHAGVPGFFAAGAIGVNLFFTLSGYLITTLLIEEWRSTGRISLRAFYVRRLLRLAPVMLVVLGVTLALAAVHGELGKAIVGDAIGALTYSANWLAIAGVEPYRLGVQWSLAIEEQFYLVWPAVVIVMVVASRVSLSKLAAAAGLLAIGSAAFRFFAYHAIPGDVYYLSTVTRADSILVGCALACAPRAWLDVAATGRRVALALVAVLVAWTWVRWEALSLGLVVADLAGIMLVAGAVTTSSRILGWRPLVALGRISYGLYLWHALILLELRALGVDPLATSIATVGGGVVVAWASYRWLESPFLRLKSRLRRAAELDREDLEDVARRAGVLGRHEELHPLLPGR